MDKIRKKILSERYELTLKQEKQFIKKSPYFKQIEKDFELSFKYKKVLKQEKQWIFIIYFADHKGKEIEIISKIGDQTSFEKRVIRALKNKNKKVKK